MFSEINGARIHYEIAGNKGSKVVLLHGWGCNGPLMKGIADALREDHQILIPDFPGHGSSGRPPEPWGVPEYAECLRKFLEEQDFIPCAVVAHSFGCRVAAWAAVTWPELFTKLVFTGAAGLRANQTEQGRKKAEAYAQKKKAILLLERIPGMKKTGQILEERLRQKYGSRDYLALDAEMRKTFVKVIQLDLREIYPLIQQSTLLIWGDADTETPLWMGREMEKLIPDAGLVILEGGTHFAYLEQSGRFNVIVKQFLMEN